MSTALYARVSTEEGVPPVLVQYMPRYYPMISGRTMTEVACKVCGETLPLTEEHFYRSKYTRSGFYGKCKECHRKMCDAWAEANPERRRELNAASNARNREKARERERVDRAQSPQKHREKVRRSYSKHRDERQAARRAYRVNHIEEERQRDREYQRRFRMEKPFIYKERQARQKARRLGVPNEKLDYEEIHRRDGGICHLCNQMVEAPDLVFDHVISMANGGPHLAHNVRTAHYVCNRKKKHFDHVS
jgi:hypothetical protein